MGQQVLFKVNDETFRQRNQPLLLNLIYSLKQNYTKDVKKVCTPAFSYGSVKVSLYNFDKQTDITISYSYKVLYIVPDYLNS